MSISYCFGDVEPVSAGEAYRQYLQVLKTKTSSKKLKTIIRPIIKTKSQGIQSQIKAMIETIYQPIEEIKQALILDEEKDIADWNQFIQIWWHFRGLLQIEFCLGFIHTPREYFFEIFDNDTANKLIDQGRIDGILYDCLKSSFQEIKKYFQIKGWDFPYGSPWDLHLAMMDEQLQHDLNEPYQVDREFCPKKSYAGARKQSKIKAMHTKYLSGKLSPNEVKAVELAFSQSLTGKVFIALAALRKYQPLSPFLKALVSQLRSQPYHQIRFWQAGILYSADSKRKMLISPDSCKEL
ncbi:MAG: hypothetical protein WBA13_01320 [Microcoleaceae cyanobacterium]